MTPGTPISGDLVLLGGGHAQVAVLKHFAMHPLPGLRLTLCLPRSQHTLFGHVAGIHRRHLVGAGYPYRSCPPCRMVKARSIHAEATAIDADGKRILFADRHPSVLTCCRSILVASRTFGAIEGAAENAVPVKPISRFGHRLDDLIRWLSLSYCHNWRRGRRM